MSGDEQPAPGRVVPAAPDPRPSDDRAVVAMALYCGLVSAVGHRPLSTSELHLLVDVSRELWVGPPAVPAPRDPAPEIPALTA